MNENKNAKIDELLKENDSQKILKISKYKNFNQSTTNDQGLVTLRTGRQSIYTQNYSMVVGTWIQRYIKDDVDQLGNENSKYTMDIVGFVTPDSAIPKEGKATYKGLSIYGSDPYDNMSLTNSSSQRVEIISSIL